MAAHDILDRATRDLDYFAEPDHAQAVHRLADAIEQAANARGLAIERERQAEAFVRFRVSDGNDECEIDLGIDYRALDPVETRYGRALDLRELGADKVLAIFGRAEPRDFIDLAELTRHLPLRDLVTLALNKDPGLDFDVLDESMSRLHSIPRTEFELDDHAYQVLLTTVHEWRTHIQGIQREVEDRGNHPDLGIGL